MRLKVAKLFGSLALICFLVPVLFTMSHFTDSPGVFDDLCYLRQAHLFQRFGLGGLNTDIRLDDDGFFSDLLKDRGVTVPPCHNYMPHTGKVSLQYPPGTGFALSLFPSGVKRAALFVTSTVVIAALLLITLWRSRSHAEIFAWTAFGCLTIYFMINPTVMSDSMPPTMALCALVGVLTSRLFCDSDNARALIAAGAVGLLLGILIDFRIANVLLTVGYFAGFLYFLTKRFETTTLIRLGTFCFCLLIGMLPTLVANAINTGVPFSTAYGGIDTALPRFDLSGLKQNMLLYFRGNQGLTLVIALGVTALFQITFERTLPKRCTQILIYTNWICNLGFFLTHQAIAAYYTMPFLMLALWILLSDIDFRQVGHLLIGTSHSSIQLLKSIIATPPGR
jgi:hypothetical protein